MHMKHLGTGLACRRGPLHVTSSIKEERSACVHWTLLAGADLTSLVPMAGLGCFRMLGGLSSHLSRPQFTHLCSGVSNLDSG